MKSDLTPWMAGLSAVIPGCAYSPHGQSMGFSREGMPVLLESRRMTIYGAQDEATVGRVLGWMAGLIGQTKLEWQEGKGRSGREQQ